MLKHAVVLTSCLVVFSGPLVANTHTERTAAEAALEGLGPVTDQITEPNMLGTVVPFAGTETGEASLAPADFDRAILDIHAGSGQDGRAYQSTLDSVSNRPDVDLGSDPLALADDAIENAEAAVGGLFSANSGTCEALFQEGSYSGLRLCKAIVQRDVRVCEIWREISVDREDFWACEMAERDYTRDCSVDVSWACTGSTGATCRRDRLRANHAFTWANANSQMRFDFAGQTEPLECLVRTKRVILESYVGFDITQLDVSRFTFKGIGQIQVNGEVVWTYGTASRGPLNIQYVVTSGKNGTNVVNPVVHAGATPIDLCPPPISPIRSAPSVSILSEAVIPRPGPSLIDANHRPYIPMGESEDIVIDLLVGSLSEPAIEFWVDVNGACCSQFTATGGEAC